MLNFKTMTIPTHEIDRTIKWLDSIKKDCDHRIYELNSLKASRARAEKHNRNMNALALEIYNEGDIFKHQESADIYIKNIQKRLNCELKRAEAVYTILQKWAKKEGTKDRNKQIILLANSGMKKTEIAEKCGLSRQMVYQIIRKYKKEIFLKGKSY